MRRKYEKPNMNLEMFEANEYIAACVKCNISKYGGVVYSENGNNGTFGKEDKVKFESARGCGEEHKINDKFIYHNAWFKEDGKGSKAEKVYYWTKGRGHHFTKMPFDGWQGLSNHS